MRQLVKGSQFLLNAATQLERIQARLLRLESHQRLGAALPGGLHALQRVCAAS